MFLNDSEIEQYLDLPLKDIVLKLKGQEYLDKTLKYKENIEKLIQGEYYKMKHLGSTYFVRISRKGNWFKSTGIVISEDRVFLLSENNYLDLTGVLTEESTKINKEEYDIVISAFETCYNTLKNYRF